MGHVRYPVREESIFNLNKKYQNTDCISPCPERRAGFIVQNGNTSSLVSQILGIPVRHINTGERHDKDKDHKG